MAQRKPASTNRSSSTNRPGGGAKKAPTAAKKSGASGRNTAPASRPPNRPPNRKASTSIVNQKQTPWTLIVSTVVIAALAIGIVVYAVTRGGSGTTAAGVDPSDPYRQPELASAKSIKGLTYKVEADHTHVSGTVKYDSTPPVGGNHSPYWADCSGTVYSQPIANENAVHMLEHGAVWITYNAKTLPASGLAVLKKDVSGIDRMALSPYPNLKTEVSLQAWGYQLFVNSATDKRVQQFIDLLRYNKQITPEYGASCSQPTFKEHPSTFGHPLEEPAS